MKRSIIASLMALSLAVTPMAAAPARAANDDLGRTLAGVITFMIFAHALDDTLSGKNRKATTSRRYTPAPSRVYRQFYLPARCYFRINTPRGPRAVYGKTCLQEFMYHAERLPRACERTVHVRYGRSAKVYDAQCLRQRGYRVEAWRH